jgi:hypothetical protein
LFTYNQLIKKDNRFLARWYKKAKFTEMKRRIALIECVNAGMSANNKAVRRIASWMMSVEKYGLNRVSNME